MNQIQQRVPDSTVRPIYESYLSCWLDCLPGYDTCEGNDRMLELSRLLWESDAYYAYLIPFPTNIVGTTSTHDPNGNAANFAAGETQTGSIQVPLNSYLVSMGGLSYSGPGFKIRIYDKGTESDLFYQQFAHNLSAGSSGGTPTNTSSGNPFGPYFPVSPLIIQEPGILQLEITNLDPQNAQCIQTLLSFACPKGSVSGNVVVQEESY